MQGSVDETVYVGRYDYRQVLDWIPLQYSVLLLLLSISYIYITYTEHKNDSVCIMYVYTMYIYTSIKIIFMK